MSISFTRVAYGLATWLFLPGIASAQTFATVGTRAQGMGGAFVGVANDASAVYWNPAGLAAGSYFSLVLDGMSAEGTPEGGSLAGAESGWILALSTPAVGLSYYRLRHATSTRVVDAAGRDTEDFRLQSLVTHHAGVTLVQSVADGIAIGATVKLLRGVGASLVAPAGAPEDLLEGWEILGRTGTTVDLDVGVMATGAMGSLGLTVRNLSAPAFRTGEELELRLARQIRAGASVLLLESWKLATDLDLTRNSGPLGDVRELALGTEGQVTRRFAARGGLRLNTAGDPGWTPAVSGGASYAVTGSVLLDVQVTGGGDEALRGWGIAGRIVF